MARDEQKNILPPDYLIFTLNRFIYQANNGNVAANLKIMEQVDYPTRIEINTYDITTSRQVIESYSLLAIVVHSGSSLHYGHYYTYMVCNQIEMNGNVDNWYLANDSHITKVSFESLSSNQNIFKDDTPYLLFYSKLTHSTSNTSSTNVLTTNITDSRTTFNEQVIRVPNTKLIEMIDQDNKNFQAEEKNRLLKKNPQNDDRYAAINKSYYSSRDDDDDSSSSGGGGGGGGGSNQPPNHCNNDSQRDSGPRIVF
jgi:ubiquitin carboxyl-terminal hydrolase 35/38